MTEEKTTEEKPKNVPFKIDLNAPITSATGKPLEMQQSISVIVEDVNKLMNSPEPITKEKLKTTFEKLTKMTVRDGLEMLLGQSTEVTLKETITLRECVFQISDESHAEIELSTKRLELLRKLAKANRGPNGIILMPLVQGHILEALGYTEEDL